MIKEKRKEFAKLFRKRHGFGIFIAFEFLVLLMSLFPSVVGVFIVG